MGIIEGGSVIESLKLSGLLAAPDAKVLLVDPSVTTFTLQDAIDACEADRGDVIVVLPGNHSVTEQVVFDKQGITVIAASFGMPEEEAAESFTVNAAASFADDYVAKILDPCKIIGLGFAGRDTTKGSLLIDCEEQGGYNGGFNELINCRFSVWYGAMDCGIRMIGGAVNKLRRCSFDGLFGGFGTGAIILENDTGPITPAYTEVEECVFQGVGSGIYAIVHAVGSTPLGVIYKSNRMSAGFVAGAANLGAFLNNNNVASTGLVADNWVGKADKAAAFKNLTNSLIKFADNHYDE